MACLSSVVFTYQGVFAEKLYSLELLANSPSHSHSLFESRVS